jgi:polysaccharide export outer membrane protein
MKYLITLFIAAVLFSSCKTQNLLDQPHSVMNEDIKLLDSIFGYDANYDYEIRQDDKITISVWGQDELSVGSSYGIYNSNEVYGKWLMVDAAGNIEIPKIGTFHAKSLTTIQLKDSLKTLFGEWILNPVVDVKILNKEITILGEVRDPGVYAVDKHYNSLFEIIAKSGGFEKYANLKYVKVFRQEGEDVRIATINLREYGNYFAQNIQLKPGDIVAIPSVRYKEFDRRVSVIIPFTSSITAAAIFKSAFGF